MNFNYLIKFNSCFLLFHSTSVARGKIHCGVRFGVWFPTTVSENPSEIEHYGHAGHPGYVSHVNCYPSHKL